LRDNLAVISRWDSILSRDQWQALRFNDMTNPYACVRGCICGGNRAVNLWVSVFGVPWVSPMGQIQGNIKIFMTVCPRVRDTPPPGTSASNPDSNFVFFRLSIWVWNRRV